MEVQIEQILVVAIAWATTLWIALKRASRTKDRVEVWQAENVAGKQWYWHRKARNNEIISNGEGYESKQGAVKGAFRANPDIKKVTVNREEVIKRRKFK